MARTYNDSGIVLRRTDLRDSDRILTVLTRDHGKLSVLAKGIRKPLAKLAAHVDLFAQAAMSFASGRSLEILIGAVRFPDTYFEDGLEAMVYASLLAEAIDRTTEPSSPVPALYDLLSLALRELAHASSSRRIIALWHLYRLLDWMGQAPLLSRCMVCSRALPDEALTFSAAAGGFFCPDHRQGRPLLPISVRPLLSLLASSDRDFFTFPFETQDLQALENLLLDLVEEHLPSPLKSRQFLRSVLLEARP